MKIYNFRRIAATIFWWLLIIIGCAGLFDAYRISSHDTVLNAVAVAISGSCLIFLGVANIIYVRMGKLAYGLKVLTLICLMLRGAIWYIVNQ
jgi:hypothetical protein